MRPFYHVKPVSVMFYRMIVLNIFIFAAEAATNHHEEHRYEEDGENGRRDHTTHYTRTYRVLCAGARAGADNQRHNAEDKRQGRHQDWTQTHTNGFQRGFNQAFSFFLHQIFGEFDDEYRVLRRQANGCQQAHLEVKDRKSVV